MQDNKETLLVLLLGRDRGRFTEVKIDRMEVDGLRDGD